MDAKNIDFFTALRADLPVLENLCYLNNASTSLRSSFVTQTMIKHLEREDAVGGHGAAAEAGERIEAVYASAARLINASPGEIALTENNTRGWVAVVEALDLGEGDEVVLSAAEYVSNQAAFAQLRKRRGVVLKVVGYDVDGRLDLDALREVVNGGTRLVALTHIATSNGTVHPVAEASAIVRASSGAFVLLDAAQSVGHLPIDVSVLDCDALTATSRKYLRGPRGAGFLYVRDGRLPRLEPAWPDGHRLQVTGPFTVEPEAGARRFETFEKSIASLLGLGAALDQLLAPGQDRIFRRIANIADSARLRLSAMPGITVHEQADEPSGIVTFSVEGVGAHDCARLLAGEGVVVKPVDKATGWLDLSERGRSEVVRASVHAYNTEADLERLERSLLRLVI